MKIGIGLPSTVPGAEGGELREWAIRAESAGFSTLGTIDRIVYPNHEPLTALAFAAAVTERIGLLTSVLLAPLRSNTALLAKQAASVDVLSGARLTLGMSVGSREDDFDVSGVDYRGRGRAFDRQLEELHRLWRGGHVGLAGSVGPQPRDGRPDVVIGGRAGVAFERAARWGSGWMMGGGPPEDFPGLIEKLDAAWRAAGRDGEPRKLALGYYALGPDAREQARRYLADYYAYIGDAAAQMGDRVPATPADVKAYADAFAQAGCDEFVFFPISSDPAQVDLLAEAVL